VNTVRVKICGLRTAETINAAIDAGADALGLVFAQSPRQVAPKLAAALTDLIPPTITSVGVFKAPSQAELVHISIACRLDAWQMDAGAIHLARDLPTPPTLIPVYRLRKGHSHVELEIDSGDKLILIEGPTSGQGQSIDWPAVEPIARQHRLMLAGGLTPDNVAEAIRIVRPFAVDVSSGVESTPGEKDPIKIRDFIQAAKAVS
jgi:phosphoribosylanthranilate isomerase